MTTQNFAITTDVQTISGDELSHVAGGDFAARYANTLKSDFKDYQNRARSTANDLRAHHWLSAAGNAGATALNEIQLGADALLPLKALKFW